MTPEVMRRIFEPFFSTKSLGRGLGLAAVGGIVRAHNAEIRAESAPGVGTTFCVAFPAVTADVAVPARPPVARASNTQTILLVDDSENFRRMCGSLLADLGFRVIDTGDGTRALEILAASGDPIDAVLIDWTMPPPCGSEMFRRLRAVRADLPIVIMSGYAEVAATDLALQGGTEFIEKPFTVETLERALRTLLGTASAPS